jgi:hypothetical protein
MYYWSFLLLAAGCGFKEIASRKLKENLPLENGWSSPEKGKEKTLFVGNAAGQAILR